MRDGLNVLDGEVVGVPTDREMESVGVSSPFEQGGGTAMVKGVR